MVKISSRARQLYLLLWKNYKLNATNKIRSMFLIIWPLFMFIILVIVRLARGLRNDMPECHFKATPLPSAGMMPYFQGLICNINNTCHESSTRTEQGHPAFERTNIDRLYSDIVNITEQLELDGLFREIENAQLLSKGRQHYNDFRKLNPDSVVVPYRNLLSVTSDEGAAFIKEMQAGTGLNKEQAEALYYANLYPLKWLLGGSNSLPAVTDLESARGQSLFCNSTGLQGAIKMGGVQHNRTALIETLCNDITPLQFQRVSIAFFTSIDQSQLLAQMNANAKGTETKELFDEMQETYRVARRIYEDSTLRERAADLEEIIGDLGYDLSFLNMTRNFNASDVNGTMAANTTAFVVEQVLKTICGAEFIMPGFAATRSRTEKYINSQEDELSDRDAAKKEAAEKTLSNNGMSNPFGGASGGMFGDLGDDAFNATFNTNDTCDLMREKKTYIDEMSCECNSQLRFFIENKPLWLTFGKFFRGKILYYPSSSGAVNRTMARLQNEVIEFEEMADTIANLTGDFELILRSATDQFRQLDNQTEFLMLIAASRNRSYTFEQYEELADSLMALSEINITEYLAPLRLILSCVSVDKFVAIDSEYQLLNQSLEHINNMTFFAAIHFMDVEDKDEFDPVVKYKIRMDTGMFGVDNT